MQNILKCKLFAITNNKIMVIRGKIRACTLDLIFKIQFNINFNFFLYLKTYYFYIFFCFPYNLISIYFNFCSFFNCFYVLYEKFLLIRASLSFNASWCSNLT